MPFARLTLPGLLQMMNSNAQLKDKLRCYTPPWISPPWIFPAYQQQIQCSA